MALSLKKISEGQIKNNLIYRKTKKQLEKKFPGKYAIIADGKFLGVEDSLENVWILASPHKNTQVTKITKEHARILGSS